MTLSTITTLAVKASEAHADDDDTLVSVCQDIAAEVESGRSTIHTVVAELGPYLTSTDVTIRANGVKTLSMVLSNLSKDYLSKTEVELLSTFYCDRLKDHHSIGPATVLGILSIVQMTNLPKDAPCRLIHELFQHIRCQSELKDTRRHVYLIFRTLSQNRIDDLRSMGADFVYSFISAMDGECEPRNLMLLFSFLPTFIREIPLGHLSEEMFEVVACYFPIDFNSSVNEKKVITRDDLAEALAPCLYAIPKFAIYCLPLVMEKLDSDRKVAKLDALTVLSGGASTFGSAGFEDHLDELWPILKKEIMTSNDPEVKSASLNAISKIIKAIAADDDDDEIRKSLVEKILTDTRWSLCDVQLSLYLPAVKLLETVARADKNSCTQILRELIPLYLGQYSTKTSKSDKIALMETLNNFVKISQGFGFTIGDVPELAWTDIPGLYLIELATPDNTLKAKTLAGLTIQKSSLKEGQRAMVYEKVCDLVESDDDDDDAGQVRSMANTTLFSFAKLYPNELLEVLKKRLQINVDNAHTKLLARRLEAISLVARISEIGVVVLPQILEIGTSNKPEVDSIALSCLYRILSSANNEFDIPNYMYKECEAIERLMLSAYQSPNKLTLVSSVCRSIVRKLSVEDQQAVADKYVKIGDGKLSESEIILFEGILTPLQQDVRITDPENLARKFFDLAVETSVPDVATSACKIMAILTNKMQDDATFTKLLDTLHERIVGILESEDSTTKTKKATIRLHTWLTKALITRGSSSSQDYLDYQLNILKMDAIGSWVSDEFKTLVDKSETTLTEENFCTIKIFYKQRIFQNLITANRVFDAESRQNYLVALAHLVEQVPIELPFMHLEGLVPLLVESLSLDDAQLLLSTLKTLKLLLETKHEIFLTQIQCFVSRCLQLAIHNKMNVRMAALDCLVSYCNYPIIELVKYKQDVLDKLAEPLDDHKRLVRQAAAKARTRWYLVGAPGTPE